MNSIHPRVTEILDTYKENPRKHMIAIAAFSLAALQMSIAKAMDQEILGQKGEDVRSSFSQVQTTMVIATCRDKDEIDFYKSCYNLIFRDLEDYVGRSKK